ncbi:MAG: LodA/GoxA family CTQ-dependent oxidase [Minicystis sp.]
MGRSIPGMTMMPYLAGDNAFFFGAPTSKFLKLTDTQYFLLQQWAEGKFRRGAAAPEPPGAALDRAVLTNCVGGGFSPGIEMTWVSRNPAIYMEPFRLAHKKDVVPPLSLGGDLRAGMEPGDACKYMALPWQADFNECSAQPVQLQMGPESGSVTTRIAWWWPAQRPSAVWRRDEKAPTGRRQVAWVGTLEDQNAPDYVQFADDLEMVTKWRDLGFIYDFGTAAKPELLVVDKRRDDGEER